MRHSLPWLVLGWTLSGCAVDPAAGAPAASLDGGSEAAPPPVPTGPACGAAWRDLQLGTELDDQAWGLTVDAERNLYASGFEHGVTGVTNIEPDGDARGVVLRIDPSGAVVWTATLDTAAADTVEDVAVDRDTGALYAVGRTSGAFAGFVNQGQFDTFLAALDSSGRVTGVAQSGDERPQHPLRLGLGASRVAVAGFDDTYVPTNFVESWEDGFVAGFDRGPGFTQKFLQKVPFTQANRVTGVAVDASGHLYVTSWVSAGADVGNYVEKLDADGTLLWSARISRQPTDMVSAVGLSPSGELFVAGATFQTLGPASFGQQDAFVLKLDNATGEIVWAGQGGSEGSDFPTAIGFDDAGDVYVSGYTNGSLPGATNQGGLDLFALKLDATGAWRASWQLGTPEDDLATGLAVDGCGQVFVGGFTKGALVHASAGGYDLFVVRARFD